MTTYNTGNPLGSTAAKDLYDNSENIDHLSLDKTNEVWPDRLGKSRLTWHGMEKRYQDKLSSMGWTLFDSFQDGATLTRPDQALRWKTPDGDGEYYRWDGSFGDNGKVVPPDSTPASTGGIGKGEWIGIGDASLRSYMFSSVINYVTPEMFGAVSYDKRTIFGSNKNSASDIAAAVAAGTIVDSTDAIQQAVNTGKPVVFMSGVYYTSKPIEQGYYTGDMIGQDVVQTAICKYTTTVDTLYGVDAVWVLGVGTNAYMRYKKIAGLSFARAKLLVNDGTLQQPKAIENFFDYTDVNLVPYGYGIYAPKLDHFELTNVMIHGSETNFYTSDMWMSHLVNVWAYGGTGFVIETGTSYTLQQTWAVGSSWSTYNTLGALLKKHYCYDLGGAYTDIASVACDHSGADGRPTESLYNFRQGVIADISSLGSEQCHARKIISTTPGSSGFTTSFINIDTVSIDSFYNKYGDLSLPVKRRVLIDVSDYCSMEISSGRIRSIYPDATNAPQKPHLAYVGKKSKLNLGIVYFFGDTIKGIQFNDVSYFTSIVNNVPTPVAITQSEIWIDSDEYQSSALSIRNGVLDINIAMSGSDLFWGNGENPDAGSFAYRYGGYCAKALGSGVSQMRVQNTLRIGALIASNDQIGLFDYNLSQWLLRHSQGTGDSYLMLGSRINANLSYVGFNTSGLGNAFDGRIYCSGGVSGTVGAGQMVLQSSLLYSTGRLSPFTTNSVSLGDATHLWTSVFATNGTIQTSDERYKFDIKNLSDSELVVAKSCASLYRTFKMKEGQSGRTHIGVIAQKVIEAFECEGLNAFDYGICCYDEWDEQTATFDEEGNEVMPALQPGNRYGIRYEEFNCFVNAGMNQILQNLDERLRELERGIVAH